MTVELLENELLTSYDGLVLLYTYAERSFFYNPDKTLPKGIYFATIKESDGPNDRASNLNRKDVYRLSIGAGKKHYQKLFGNPPARPAKGGVVDVDFDFKELNVLMPHPVYAWLGWVAILNPEKNNLETVKQILDISYKNVLDKFDKKKKT